jgi:predicted O-methyltransferase YrrM
MKSLETKGAQVKLTIPGWFRNDQVPVYQDLVKPIVKGKMVEVGNHKGRSLSCIFDICRDNQTKIFCIDIQTTKELKTNLDEWGNVDTVEICKGDSILQSQKFEDGSLDLIFLDGCHTDDYVRVEIEAWKPKLKSTGTMCGHDFSKDHSGVIYSLLDKCHSFRVDRNIWIVEEFK